MNFFMKIFQNDRTSIDKQVANALDLNHPLANP